MDHRYGEAPVAVSEFSLPDWTEFMHYLYLPVRLPEHEYYGGGDVLGRPVLPTRLEFLRPAVLMAMRDSIKVADHLHDPYVYVTARRGFATPGNPLNRPGWHCDDFGGTDLNYIWTDEYPTRVLRWDDTLDVTIPEDDAESMQVMQDLAYSAGWPNSQDLWMEPVPLHTMLRLSPYVIHDTPIIPSPGGMRSFFKISVSTHRYDLIGNSHNHLLDYDWPMHSRESLRNQPSGGNKDYSQ